MGLCRDEKALARRPTALLRPAIREGKSRATFPQEDRNCSRVPVHHRLLVRPVADAQHPHLFILRFYLVVFRIHFHRVPGFSLCFSRFSFGHPVHPPWMRWIARIFFEPEESKRHSKQGPRRLAADRRRIPLIFPSHDAYPTVRPDIISPLMTAPLLTPEQIAEVSLLVAKYITTQRERYAPRAAPLSAQQKATLGGFFSPELVDSTRLLVLRGERV